MIPKTIPVVSLGRGQTGSLCLCLYAENAENIAVTGLGMLDGQERVEDLSGKS